MFSKNNSQDFFSLPGNNYSKNLKLLKRQSAKFQEDKEISICHIYASGKREWSDGLEMISGGEIKYSYKEATDNEDDPNHGSCCDESVYVEFTYKKNSCLRVNDITPLFSRPDVQDAKEMTEMMTNSLCLVILVKNKAEFDSIMEKLIPIGQDNIPPIVILADTACYHEVSQQSNINLGIATIVNCKRHLNILNLSNISCSTIAWEGGGHVPKEVREAIDAVISQLKRSTMEEKVKAQLNNTPWLLPELNQIVAEYAADDTDDSVVAAAPKP